VTFDTAPFWIFGATLVAGFLLTATGIWSFEKRTTEAQLRRWPTFPAHLAETVAALPNSAAIQEEMRSASRRRSRIMLVGAGAGLIFLSGAPLLLQLFLNQVVAGLLVAHVLFAEELETVPALIAVEVGAISLGFCICLAACFSVVICPRDRRREHTTIRRVSDIRSPLVLLFPLAPVLLSLVLLGLAATSRGYVTPASRQFLLAIPWIPYAIPSLLVLLFLTVELCVWGICQLSPRHWITEAPENVAKDADIYVRSRTICFMYYILSITIGAYLISQSLLISRIFYLSSFWTLVMAMLPALWYLAPLWLYSVTYMGQLGGRLTGWWWQQHATSQAAG
jgi:hypothetical protein